MFIAYNLYDQILIQCVVYYTCFVFRDFARCVSMWFSQNYYVVEIEWWSKRLERNVSCHLYCEALKHLLTLNIQHPIHTSFEHIKLCSSVFLSVAHILWQQKLSHRCSGTVYLGIHGRTEKHDEITHDSVVAYWLLFRLHNVFFFFSFSAGYCFFRFTSMECVALSDIFANICNFSDRKMSKQKTEESFTIGTTDTRCHRVC